jgi:NTE family protein
MTLELDEDRPGDRQSPRVAVVLGGGGLKGFAHIGALRAIEDAGIRPSLYAGTSIGALIAAAHVGGLPLESMATRAASLKRRDLFRLNHVGMLLDRLRADSMYLEEPLRALAENNTPKCTFEALPTPLIVNTVDIERGTLVPWGAPGLRDVRVSDAVYASCALPGFFPPGEIGGRRCVDGGTMDNLPIEIAALDADLVVAVDVGNTDLLHDEKITRQGFASVYMRAATIMMYSLQGLAFSRRTSPPTILVRPRIASIGWFDFGRSEELADEGYRATKAALADWQRLAEEPSGIFPRRALQLAVDQDKCTGCGLCVALAPHVMALDGRRKAYPLTRRVAWAANEGDFVRQCPTEAISCERVELPEHAPAHLPPSVPRHSDVAQGS